MDEGLRAELLRRMEKDQVARKALDHDGIREADGENLPWLKGVIEEHGWPGTSLVGKDGAMAAFLLAQHADTDPAFQRECLDLMTVAVDAGEASKRNLAYLTDRVLLAEGKQQEYGTQVVARGGRWVPRNLRDPDAVDARRAAADLDTIAEYLTLFTQPPEPARLKCAGCDEQVPWEMPDDFRQPLTVTCPKCGRETTVTFGSPG